MHRIRKIIACTAIALACLSACAPAQESAAPGAASQPALAVPTANQRQWQDMAFGLFFHWAPNVYQSGEGDNRSTPRAKINPDRFNAERWVDAAQAAHAGYIIFVAKHVGGYCCWQTKTTDYSLKTSPWKDGQGDMVGELAKACAARGIKFGVYLSPRDDEHGIGNGGHAGTAEKQKEYNELYRQQLTEMLTNYGTMCEIWFDGGNRVPVNDLLDQHAPGIVTFQGRRTGGSRWVGTEYGHAPYPCWNTIDWQPGQVPHEGAGTPTGNLWCPAECDVSIIRPRWFWSPGCDKAILGHAALLQIYYLSVGRGANLLLNLTPDDHGEVPAAQMQRLTDFGADIAARFAQPLATTKGEGNTLTLDLHGPQSVDHVRLREDTTGGERVRNFRVQGHLPDGHWNTLLAGTQIGNRQILPFHAVTVTELRLTVQEAAAAPVTIREFSAFHVDKPVPALAYHEGATPALRLPQISRSKDGIFAIDCPTPDWEVRYTLDGTEPTRQSTLYHEPQPLPLGGLLKTRYFEHDDPAAAGGPVATRYLGLAQGQIKVVRASSQEDNTPATAAFDGDPKTMWHTAWRKGPVPPPHEIVVDLGQSYAVNGIAYLARQDAVGNFPLGIQVWVSDKSDAFAAQPQFSGDFGDFTKEPHAWHQVLFGQATTGRYVRLVYLDELRHTKCVASAEIEILVHPADNRAAGGK